MGYQLWTSPVTGYRRRGTRLSDFRAGLGQKITAADLFEPLQSCPLHAAAAEMNEELARRDFDIAGVRADASDQVIGFVQREKLEGGQVSNHVETIDGDAVIAETTSLDDLLELLRARRFLFVRIGGQIKGILTVADLNKPLVRVYFFGLISLLEIHLSYWTAQMFPDDSWKEHLSKGRLTLAEQTRAMRHERGQNLALMDCLQFADRRSLVVLDDQLRKNLGLGSKTKAKEWLSEAEDLRNTLAHSQYDLVSGSSWADAIGLIQLIMDVIGKSDRLVEDHAAEMAQGFIGALW
jgi:hypothetical protein